MAAKYPEDAESDSNDCITCIVCRDTQKTQKLLQCFHPCCKECLDENITDNTITCPACSHVTKSIENLPSNFLQHIEEQLHEMTEDRVCEICKAHDKEKTGTYICLQCNADHLCAGCRIAHSWMTKEPVHRPVAIATIRKNAADILNLSPEYKPAPCKEHDSKRDPQTLAHFCKTCQQYICQKCRAAKHKKHDVITNKEYAHQTRSMLSTKRGALLQKRKEIVIILRRAKFGQEKTKMKVDETQDNLQKRIERLKKLASDEITEQVHNLLEKVQQYGVDSNAMASTYVNSLDQLRIRMEHAIVFSYRVITKCPDEVLIRQQKFVADELRNTIEEAEKQIKEERVIDLSEQEAEIENLTKDLVTNLLSHLRHVLKKDEIPSIPKAAVEMRITCLGTQRIHGLALSEDDDIFVVGGGSGCSTKQNVVFVFSKDGSEKPPIQHNVKNPCQLAVSKDHFYLADFSKHCIKRFTMEGIVDKTITSNPPMRGELGLCVTEDDTVYITCESMPCILWCTSDSDVATPWNTSDVELTGPQCLCRTRDGGVAVTDKESHQVVMFDKEGNHQFTYGEKGSEDGQLKNPAELCGDGKGNLYIADTDNDRISMISNSGHLLDHVITKALHGISKPTNVQINPHREFLAVGYERNKLAIFDINF